jgi:molybdopterin molybdotransferase
VPGELISVEEARRRVLALARPLPEEVVPCGLALGRVLSEDVASEEDLPPVDSSAMDGYAVAAGANGELAVVGESRAGTPAARAVGEGEAIAISTGAQVPEGTGAVVPVERTRPAGAAAAPGRAAERRVVVEPLPAGANIRRAGEDVRAGATVLHAGTPIGPAEIAMLAQVGRTEVRVGGRPRVAVVVTGDELVEPGEPLGPGQIRDSNAPALAALATAAGAAVTGRHRVGDSFDDTVRALRDALAEADVVCVSGGVSVGEHDHVKPALAELGVEQSFWGVALKPGKPTWFGATAGGELVFGLPGNPVSAMVTFQLFAQPALRALAGADPSHARVRARLDAPVRLNANREQAIRVKLRAHDDGWHAEPTGPQGSHQISSLLGADALALVPTGDGELAAGEVVHAEPLARGTVIP